MITSAAVAIVASVAIYISGYVSGHRDGFQSGVNATIPEAAKDCTVATIATFRNASRMLEAKNRQTELALQRAQLISDNRPSR